jgi:peroxin-7
MHLFFTNFHGSAVKFSPFPQAGTGGHGSSQLLAVATSQYFGIAGNGRVHALVLTPEGGLRSLRHFDTQDGVYDVAWNELNERQLAAGCGDGSVRIFDLSSPDPHPVRAYQGEHAAEVAAVSWGGVDKRLFATASWDATLRVFDPAAPASVATLRGHEGAVYGCEWHPRWARVLASCSQDRTVALWAWRRGRAGAGR